jgi:hypothetical protein
MRQLPATYHPTSIAASIQELRGSVTSAKRLHEIEPPSWGDLPVLVISTRTTSDQDRGYHAELASRSSEGHHLVMHSAGHYAHYQQPTRVTAILRNLLHRLLRDGAAPSPQPRVP